MAEGELRCMGSSLFLKGLYGVGYTLTVITGEQQDNPHSKGIKAAGGNGRGSLMVRFMVSTTMQI